MVSIFCVVSTAVTIEYFQTGATLAATIFSISKKAPAKRNSTKKK